MATDKKRPSLDLGWRALLADPTERLGWGDDGREGFFPRVDVDVAALSETGLTCRGTVRGAGWLGEDA